MWEFHRCNHLYVRDVNDWKLLYLHFRKYIKEKRYIKKTGIFNHEIMFIFWPFMGKSWSESLNLWSCLVRQSCSPAIRRNLFTENFPASLFLMEAFYFETPTFPNFCGCYDAHTKVFYIGTRPVFLKWKFHTNYTLTIATTCTK